MVIKIPDALWVTFERYLTGDSVAADEGKALPGYAFICGICGCPFLTSMLDAGMSERSADPADPQDCVLDVRRLPNPNLGHHPDPDRLPILVAILITIFIVLPILIAIFVTILILAVPIAAPIWRWHRQGGTFAALQVALRLQTANRPQTFQQAGDRIQYHCGTSSASMVRFPL